MPYESSIAGMPVISDDNASQFIDPIVDGQKRFCAATPRDLVKYPHGGTGFAAIRPLPVYSHEEVVARIRQRKAARSGLADILTTLGVDTKDQNGRSLCWIYACTHILEAAFAVQGRSHRPLSATAAGAMITGGMDRGGYGAEGFDFLSQHGTCFEDEWPEHDLSLRNKTPQVEASCKQNVITQWGELPNGNLDQLNSALLHDFPVAIGLGWWRHEVVIIDFELLAGDRIGYVFDNSWSKNWGKNGRGVLTAEKARGDMFYPLTGGAKQ